MNLPIVIVDDDDSIRTAICQYLARHGYTVHGAADGVELDRVLTQGPVSLVVLDLMLPGEDGLAICRRLAGAGLPIIMLSALGAAEDRIVGLELGAADYLAKPFLPRELLARVRAVLRRPQATASSGRTLHFLGWTFQRDARQLRDPEGQPVALTGGELRLLCAFLDRPQRLLSRERLLQATSGDTAESFDRAVDLAISRLRRKLAAHGGAALIETVRGEGYRFSAPVHGR